MTRIIPATKAITLLTRSIMLTRIPKESSAISYPIFSKFTLILVWLPFAKFPKLDLIKSFAEIWGIESAKLTSEVIELNIITKPTSKRTPPAINIATPRLI